MAYFLATARLIDPTDKKIMNTEKISKFITSLYIKANGGFGPEPGLGTTQPSTFYGLFCLFQTKTLTPTDTAGLAWLFSF